MRIDYLSSDILLFRGDSLAALATAFIDGERVLLVDALASQFDALDMRDYLENTLRKQVAQIVLTDAVSMATVRRWPCSPPRKSRAPDAPAIISWGRHTLELHPAHGGLHIDVPGADLMFVGDSIVGNIAVLGATQPDLADQTLVRLLDRGRARVVPRTVGAVCNRALGNARAYLAQLRSRVLELRNTLAPEEAALAIGRITIETCIAHGELATPLERHWHADNLKRIVAA
ncbi:hypothetical protein LP419_18350 [Massilia sp. H-1]|nr:hypothetical protein LP419_18350 [Massilia sp. H-1]